MEKATVRVNRAWRKKTTRHPAGLLQFHPHPAAQMRYISLSSRAEIGRSEACSISCPDEEMSRRHALIERLAGSARLDVDGQSTSRFLLRDNDSANGVFVNAQPVKEHELVGGDVIRMGSTLFRFFSEGLFSDSCSYEIPAGEMVGGPSLREVRTLLEKSAGKAVNVLIIGETGTGKELAASHVHTSGPRAGGPLVPVNCGAIPGEIIESELFGHVKGAFTGANTDAIGLIRQSNGGTLFLDEIGELPLESQAKLLRVIQERLVRPVGSARAEKVDFGIVSATNRELPELVAEGRFRADLFARIGELVVYLPPLAERVEDIPMLVERFLKQEGAAENVMPVETLEHLCCQPWPFNIRQLRSSVVRALLLLGDERELRPQHFLETPPRRRPRPPSEGVELQAAEAQGVGQALVAAADVPAARRLRELLEKHRGDANKTAEELGLSRSQLYRRAKRYGINVADYRA
jgi:DNA-binding NtrC family response regulator